jgi:hypothetical protein
VKKLSACPQATPIHVRGTYRGAIVDPRTNQRLELQGDDRFVVYTLDDAIVTWGAGKKPDGILIVDIDGRTWVCFIEIKGKLDSERAFAQLTSGAEHFCPGQRSGGNRTHGDEHHDNWTNGLDDLRVMPGSDHRTIGVFVTPRMLPVTPPRPPKTIGGRAFPVRAVQVSKEKPNRARISPRELLRKTGLL